EPSEIDDGSPKPNAFNIKGKSAHIQTFIGLLNRTTGNTYAYDADTKTIIRTSTTLNTITDATKSAYLSQLIEDVITGNKKFFECKIVNNDSEVLFDGFNTTEIDIADLQKAPDNAFLAGLLVHLIEERIAVPNGGYREDSKKKDYNVYFAAHNIALQKEAEVVAAMLGLSGVTKRIDATDREPNIGNPVKETITYTYGTTKYEFKISYDVIVNMEATRPQDRIKYVNKGVITGSIIKK
ncbi:MAG: hypothetical protein ACK40K_00385, partial [Raineya sp.]